MSASAILARFGSADVTDGKPKAVQIGGKDVVLVRHGGRICALSGTCTHLGASLAEGVVVDGEIRCPWHHARFSLETGEAVGAPAFEGLTVYDVVEEGNEVVVTAATHKETPKAALPEIGRIVIVGSGGAGHACAEMLGRLGAGANVTLLSQDRDEPYDRDILLETVPGR